jgi:hypothetical protein
VVFVCRIPGFCEGRVWTVVRWCAPAGAAKPRNLEVSRTGGCSRAVRPLRKAQGWAGGCLAFRPVPMRTAEVMRRAVRSELCESGELQICAAQAVFCLIQGTRGTPKQTCDQRARPICTFDSKKDDSVKLINLLPALALLLLAPRHAVTGNIEVLAVDLAGKKEISATADREGGLKFTSSPRALTLAITAPDRECRGAIKMKPNMESSESKEFEPATYENNRPKTMARTKRTRTSTVSGYRGVEKITCSDGASLICEFHANSKMSSGLEGVCASANEEIKYRVISK